MIFSNPASLFNKMKKIFKVLILVVFLSTSILQVAQTKEIKVGEIENRSAFKGNWYGKNEELTFEITLKPSLNNDKMFGFHCGVLLDGSRSDCVVPDEDFSIVGNTNKNTANIIIKSTFTDIPIKAELELKGKNLLSLKLLNPPVAEFYIPKKILLKRE